MKTVVACVCSHIWKAVGGSSLERSLVLRIRGSIRLFRNVLELSGRQAGALQGLRRQTKWILYCFSGNKSVFVMWLLVNKKLIKASARCMPLAPISVPKLINQHNCFHGSSALECVRALQEGGDGLLYMPGL